VVSLGPGKYGKTFSLSITILSNDATDSEKGGEGKAGFFSCVALKKLPSVAAGFSLRLHRLESLRTF
jgi:hypothetical protein